MKKITYIFLLVIGIASTSCMTVFDPDFDKTPVIYLESFPGMNADKVLLSIEPGYSRSNTAEVIPFDPEIIFEVNGNVFPVECIDVEEGRYVSAYEPVPGDKLSISVSSKGFTSIFAQTTIPEPFPERKIDYRQVQSGIKEYDNVVYVTFSGAKPKLHYGMYFLYEKIVNTEPEPYVRTDMYSGWVYPDPSDYGPTYLDAISLYQDGVNFLAWDGNRIDSQSCTLSVDPGSLSYETIGEQEEYDDYGNFIGNVSYVSHTKIMLMSMTDEFYKYQVAQSHEADYSGLIGVIAPSSYCYSNIDNGYGAFAGVTIVGTDWITEEFIEKNR